MALSREIAETIAKRNIPAERVVETLRSYKLLSLLPSVRKELERLSREEEGRDTIRIESPFPLDEGALSRIRRIAGNDLAETDVTINKELLSGFKARWKGRLYDGSAGRIIRQLLSK